MNDHPFLEALRCSHEGTPPVWCLRQAGRYMAAYRKLKERYSFLELCLIPELAVEVTLQPIQAFDFDAAILFSDILLPLKAIGLEPSFEGPGGPKLTGPTWTELCFPSDLAAALKESIGGVYTAASMLASHLDRPLIGFSGAPWTLASYMGAPFSLSLIKSLEDLVVEHINLQIQAGCRAIQIFDSRIDLLPPDLKAEYSFQPFQRIVRRLAPCPVIFYKAQVGQYPEGTALSCDASIDLPQMRQLLGPSVPLQGNLDPRWLLNPQLATKVHRICRSMEEDRGFIFNLSHGILPQTDEAAVRCLVDAVRGRL